MQSWAGRGQRADCLTEVDAAESLLLLGNSGDRCLPPSVQKQDGRRTKPQRSPTGDDTIATEGRWSWPPELPPPQVAAPIVQRFAVHRRSPERQVDNTPAPESPVSLCVPRRCSRASSGATAGWTTGPPYQASPAAEAKLHPRHSGITAGELDEFVEGP